MANTQQFWENGSHVWNIFVVLPLYLHISFACGNVVILHTFGICMGTKFDCSNHRSRSNEFNFYVMDKNALGLLSDIIVLCGNCVESSKIASYFELRWTKYFHFSWRDISTYFSTFVKTDWHIIHKICWILILQKHVPKESYYVSGIMRTKTNDQACKKRVDDMRNVHSYAQCTLISGLCLISYDFHMHGYFPHGYIERVIYICA